MDYFSTTLHGIQRGYQGSLRLHKIGYIPHKENWIRYAYSTFNFSFILSGNGKYQYADREYPVVAPCVILQRPGQYVEYGPFTWWEEAHIAYEGWGEAHILNSGLALPDVHVWKINRFDGVLGWLHQIADCAHRFSARGVADQLDRLSQAMIIESWQQDDPVKPTARERVVQDIRGIIEERFMEQLDFAGLASRHGMSDSTFRRSWSQHNMLTPHQYQTQLRMREACRLLVRSKTGIGRIAEMVGYDDVLYFSRRFRQMHGMSARHYRQMYS
jgi:AraC-like DNA-binding protein